MPFDGTNFKPPSVVGAICELRQARDLLLRKGWRKGLEHWPWWLGGGYCLIGAVKAVSAGEDARVALERAASRSLPLNAPLSAVFYPVQTLNDHYLRTREDALRVMDRAIEIAEAHSLQKEERS